MCNTAITSESVSRNTDAEPVITHTSLIQAIDRPYNADLDRITMLNGAMNMIYKALERGKK